MNRSPSEDIAAFLFARGMDPERDLLLKTDPQGTILSVMGNCCTAEPGKAAADIFPFLHTSFPDKPMESVDLPRIEWKGHYFNVSVFRDQGENLWILLADVSDTVEKMRPHIQQNNDYALARKQQQAFDSPFGGLYLFGVGAFLFSGKTTFITQGTLPGWAKRYFPEIVPNGTVDLVELFPYLDVFLYEALEHWTGQKETLWGSDMWIENPEPGVELHFRAFALTKNGNRYLLIRQFENDDIPLSQPTIQKAREHQLLYEKLQKAEQKLKELLYYKDKFVSIVSHDLRSPMASVVSIAEMLLTDEQLLGCMSDFNREMLTFMKEELERLLEYNNRLYHWSNLELGNFQLDVEKVQVSKLFESVAQTARNKLEAKQIRFSVLLPEDFEIDVDVSLFLQALNNLVGNAIKFTPEKGVIRLGAERKNGKIRFFVSDTGVGMPAKVQESVFAGVPNASTLGTSGEKGSGLGLDIVKKIVQAHGFSISVKSELGKGSTFEITA